MTTLIPIRNLYYLYAYAWDQFHFVQRVQTGEEENGPDAVSFFSRVLLKACSQIFRRGVDRNYHPVMEELGTVRGRISVPETFKRGLLERARLCCEYEELRYDALHNQIIKATLWGRRTRADPKLKQALSKTIAVFDSIGVRDIKVRGRDFRRIQLHRNNAFYGFLLHICELLHYGLFPEQTGSKHAFASLEDETRMSRIFERFVRNFLRQEQNIYSVQSERIEWDLSGESGTSMELLPSMQTDITLRSADRTIVIDAKFYSSALQAHYDKERLRSGHLYQLFTYVKNLEKREGPDSRARGVLLYPLVQGAISFAATVQGHRLEARTIDLTGPWSTIRTDLLSIVN